MFLVDKIIGRVKHWSTKYARRVQLINNITFAITNYYMQCFPLPKFVMKKIDAICKSFLWTGGADISRKSPIAWKNVCRTRKQGGLDTIDLYTLNRITLMKLLWNLSGKSDNL